MASTYVCIDLPIYIDQALEHSCNKQLQQIYLTCFFWQTMFLYFWVGSLNAVEFHGFILMYKYTNC